MQTLTPYAPIPTLLAYLYPGRQEISLHAYHPAQSDPYESNYWTGRRLILTPLGEAGPVRIAEGPSEQSVRAEEVDWHTVREVLTLLAIDQSTQEEEERERLSRLAEQKRILADKLSRLSG
jgi:hypothetical protein